jgi:hypothetical protein
VSRAEESALLQLRTIHVGGKAGVTTMVEEHGNKLLHSPSIIKNLLESFTQFHFENSVLKNRPVHV